MGNPYGYGQLRSTYVAVSYTHLIESIACSQVVTNIDDDGPGSLRYVIECSSAGDTITFHASLHGLTIQLNSDPITINKNLYIHSSLTAPRIMISANVQGAFKIEAGYTVEMLSLIHI